MWRVGILRGASFLPLADAPPFPGETQAAAWARDQLAADRIHLAPGRDLLTWRTA